MLLPTLGKSIFGSDCTHERCARATPRKWKGHAFLGDGVPDIQAMTLLPHGECLVPPHTHTHTHPYPASHSANHCTHGSTHAYTPARLHALTHARTPARTHACTPPRLHARRHPHAPTRTHTHTHWHSSLDRVGSFTPSSLVNS